ncbi:dihydropteroate synthase [Coriobacteriia bacterium Es71-Z0120]|uniref:dihydropteroate synthase n=1 Tax=Parvivirga hydrogeniphila TaxID=2939460 RepID=UPI002260DD34|nr:dihydropteroate synthase [Parvivirga hydrogeniphila]MCL4079410.1 dihydropteroate synthase [Parvivirga hydrogeniphila]
MGRVWQCGRLALGLERPLVMGIVNVTPDSFSDGGEHATADAAVEHGLRLVSEGADVLDVGGESTRPGADEVPPDVEAERVLPVVERLARDAGVPVSIDTRHARVAEAAIAAGASIVNDVAGFRDPAMAGVAARSDAGLVVMHMLGEPKSMQVQPYYDDVVSEVRAFLSQQADTLIAAGVARSRICVDPGIGFGKTLDHNLELLRALPKLASLGFPVLVGASRKRMIGDITGEADPKRRLGGSVGVALWAAARGARVLRVHDVRETVQALAVWRALEGEAT